MTINFVTHLWHACRNIIIICFDIKICMISIPNLCTNNKIPINTELMEQFICGAIMFSIILVGFFFFNKKRNLVHLHVLSLSCIEQSNLSL